MNRIDRELVARLLENETLSYREIAREAGCSDWSVRAIARNLAGDSRPMKTNACEPIDPEDPPGSLGGLIVCASLILALPLTFMVLARSK